MGRIGRIATDNRSDAVVSPEIDGILKQCKQVLQDLYGERFAGLVLYGSMARGDYHDESDIDLLVLLHGEVNPYSEIWPIVHALYPFQLEFDRLISAKAVSVQDYEASRWSFFRNVRREGVRV